MNDQQKNTPEIEDAGNEIIGSIADVSRWLKVEGYCAPGKDEPVHPNKVYGDRKKGLLSFSNPKAITKIEIQAYITKARLEKSGVDLSKKREVLSLKILEHQEKKEAAVAESKEFELKIKKDLYVLKKDSLLEKALAISALNAILKQEARIKGNEIASAFSAGVQYGVEAIYNFIDDGFDVAGRMDEIKVVIRKQKGMIDGNAASYEKV